MASFICLGQRTLGILKCKLQLDKFKVALFKSFTFFYHFDYVANVKTSPYQYFKVNAKRKWLFERSPLDFDLGFTRKSHGAHVLRFCKQAMSVMSGWLNSGVLIFQSAASVRRTSSALQLMNFLTLAHSETRWLTRQFQRKRQNKADTRAALAAFFAFRNNMCLIGVTQL